MSLFTVTYWTGATQVFDTMTIRDAASLAGYSVESCMVNGIHIWDLEDNGVHTLEMSNSEGDTVATIRAGGNDPDIEIVDSIVNVYAQPLFLGKSLDTVTEQDIDDTIIVNLGSGPSIEVVQNWPIPFSQAEVSDEEIAQTEAMFGAENVARQFKDSEIDICMVMTHSVSLNSFLSRSMDEYRLMQGNID